MTAFRSEGAAFNNVTNQGTLPADVRKGYQGLFTSTGVLPSSDSPLVEGAGDFSYTVHTGYWVTSRGGSDGYHYWGNLGDVSLSTADDGVSTLSFPAPGLERIDVIYALHPSASENGDADSVPVIAVAKGEENAPPVAPSIPVGALELARNTMTSAATSTDSAGNTIAQTAARAQVQGTRLRRVSRTAGSVGSVSNAAWVALGGFSTTVASGLPASDINTASTSQVSVNFTGWARVRARVTFASNTTGVRLVRIVKNGATTSAVGAAPNSAIAVTRAPAETEWEGPVSPGDVFTVDAYQNSGAALGTYPTNGGVMVFVERTD